MSWGWLKAILGIDSAVYQYRSRLSRDQIWQNIRANVEPKTFLPMSQKEYCFTGYPDAFQLGKVSWARNSFRQYLAVYLDDLKSGCRVTASFYFSHFEALFYVGWFLGPWIAFFMSPNIERITFVVLAGFDIASLVFIRAGYAWMRDERHRLLGVLEEAAGASTNKKGGSK